MDRDYYREKKPEKPSFLKWLKDNPLKAIILVVAVLILIGLLLR